jgi:hypothetical protein
MKAIILEGGLGTRISEETPTRPKPMVKICSKPILWHILGVKAVVNVTTDKCYENCDGCGATVKMKPRLILIHIPSVMPVWNWSLPPIDNLFYKVGV